MASSLSELLNHCRQELLDLSTRNRLLSMPVNSKAARIIQVRDELSEQVLRLLVTEKKSLSFLPGAPGKTEAGSAMIEGIEGLDIDEDEIGLPQPEESEERVGGVARRHLDPRLQTALSPEALQRRLLDLYGDARTMIEEQGVNVLYLSLGQLRWFEPDRPDAPRHAPLVLVPVELVRKTASDRFRVRWREEDLEENLSLEAKLKADYGIQMPSLPEEEDFSLEPFFRATEEAVRGLEAFEVLRDAIVLGFFSFSKFLMYRDLDPANWPDGRGLLEHPLIEGLMHGAFPSPQAAPLEDADLDELIPAARLDHVVDADGSQTLAIEMARQGLNLVVQGPPGTGKSQSITNIIATAVLDGKKVLFVAEKLAALEVVKRRLEQEGLGPLCLELHSGKASRRAVIEEIGRAWKLGRPKAEDLESVAPKLEACRTLLNQHARMLHERHSPSGLSPFLVMGHLDLLGGRGIGAADLGLAGAESWTPQERAECRLQAEELAGRVRQIGLPSQHPWRGVCRETVLNIDLPEIGTRIRALLEGLGSLRESCSRLAGLLNLPPPANLVDARRHRLFAEFVAQAPEVDRQALRQPAWHGALDRLRDLLKEGRHFQTALMQAGAQVISSAWDQDFAEIRSHFAAHGQSLFRFLNGDYRRALARIRGVQTGRLPEAFADRLALVDQVVTGQRALRAIRNDDALGQGAFGSLWRREHSDWQQLEAVLNWVSLQRQAGLDAGFLEMFAGIQDQDGVARALKPLSTALPAASQDAAGIADMLKLDWAAGFGMPDVDQAPLVQLAERCQTWLARLDELTSWNNYFVRAKRGRDLGLGALVDRLESGAIKPEDALDCFDRACFSQVLRDMIRRDPTLAQFDGSLHQRRIAEFRELDQDRLALAKYRVLQTHYDAMPHVASGIGPAGIVRAEIERKRGHRAVRRLLRDAVSVVQAIKPVFMMSPLSVAQFLEPGAIEFDMLVIDEASQVQPVDALGSIARCRQVVVVGDDRQLPPTRFFQRLTTNPDGLQDQPETAEAAEAGDIESILGLCVARGLPQSMLRWHYRSRHHTLIAVSNREFYQNKLFIVPSPRSSDARFGLRFHHVPQGVFDAGGSGCNRLEAGAVCRAVIDHARNTPHLSLGVAAFSIRQRQAILDELELLRRENPDLEDLFVSHPDEPFFVKNLENVQGDERDVVFISVGYGRDARGSLAMRFGPLGQEGGERRLNVLISRAKLRCEVFSSITDEEIDLDRASGRGVAALKSFLGFSRTGRMPAVDSTGVVEATPFEESACRAVESLGFQLRRNVGVAGFFVDLAVCDPRDPSSYLLGIECDGVGYRSCRFARERDRLRQAVLEDHGWTIHRVWITDWFQRPREQLKKVSEAIERARVAAIERANREDTAALPVGAADDNHAIEREAADADEGLSSLATPYREARFGVPANRDPQDLPARDLASVLRRIVEVEGPIHEDELVARVRDLSGLERAGPRLQDAVSRAVHLLLVTRACWRENGFVFILDAPVPVRNREKVQSPGLRRADMLPPMEIRAAILAIIDAHHGAAPREIPPAVARLLGFKTTSPQLRCMIEAQIERLMRTGDLELKNEMLARAEKPSAA